MYTTSDLAQAKAIIDRMVQIHPQQGRAFAEVTFSQKLYRLEELIDALRFRYPDESRRTTSRVFLPDEVFADDESGLLHFKAATGHREVTGRHRPGELVLPLLDYLYNHPGNGRRVLHIIRDFIRHYHSLLRPGDFVRTRTGVVRVETTLRDAARILRWCGLLQYTQHEKQKTWRLSVLGILSASAPPARAPCPHAHGWIALWRHMFLTCIAPMQHMPELTARLEAIAKSLALPWNEVQPFSRLTMETLTTYQSIASAPARELPQRIRIAAVEALLFRLNSAPEARSMVEAFDRRAVRV